MTLLLTFPSFVMVLFVLLAFFDFGSRVVSVCIQLLQDALLGFLSARGIDSALASFVLAYGARKDQAHYVKWLQDVLDWVNAGRVMNGAQQQQQQQPQKQSQQHQQQQQPRPQQH
jgi:hypothetical protein